MQKDLRDFVVLLYKPLHTDEMEKIQIHQLPLSLSQHKNKGESNSLLSSHGSRQMQYQEGHLPDSYRFCDTRDHVFKRIIMPR